MSVPDWNNITALTWKKLENICVVARMCDNIKTDY